MPGYGDYTAESVLNWITGQIPMPALPSVWLALFTVAPTADAGTRPKREELANPTNPSTPPAPAKNLKR